MANFSPALYKAASGAEVLPVSKERSDEPFKSPIFEDYLAANDITGYMTALWKGVPARDAESMRVLFYLSIRDEELDNALSILDMLLDMRDEYALSFWYYMEPLYEKMMAEDTQDLKLLLQAFNSSLMQGDTTYQQQHPKYKSMFTRFGDAENSLLRAYTNNVGRQSEPQASKEVQQGVFKNCAPQEKKDYWRSLYRRSDCSSNQVSIYEEAKPYAEKGDPYAMYIVGYLLSHGIATKYSSPQIVFLPVDKDKALTWLKNATTAQVPQAFWEVGSICLDRSCKDEALDYIRQGAELGEKQCLKYLAQYIDDETAKVQHLIELVEQYNDNKARLQLAEHYEKGIGCEINPQKAFELVEYVYNHSSVSPYDSSQENSANKLIGYLRSGFGCEKNPDRAGDISCSLEADNDRMWELLTK